jgi:hypothetical protein
VVNRVTATLVDLQLDAQNSYLFIYNTFIKILYMFRALPCSSSGGLRRNCIYAASGIVTVCRWLFCAPVKKELFLNRCTPAYATQSTLKPVPTLPRLRQIAVTVWQIPDAVDTVVCAPDDGWNYHPKHVEQFPDINKLCNVASCWIYIGILLGAHPILHISRIKVNLGNLSSFRWKYINA